jgi:Phospholipid methyltransferase
MMTEVMLDLLMQTLNIGIFRAIGHVGVYYGFKLGHQVCMHCVRHAPAYLEFGLWTCLPETRVFSNRRECHTSLQVPWVDGFPFNVVSHPQYVGSVLSIWGLVVALWQQQPEGTVLVAAYWTLLYAFTAVQEGYL